MAYRIGIVGASGYGGVELLRLLSAHPEIEVASVAAHSQAGTPISELFPNLPGDRVFDPIDLDRLGELDLVFLATPHGPAIEVGGALADAGVKVVDLSAAFRLDPEGFRTWYHEEHPRPDLAPAVFGLTEYTRAEVAEATLVANPGCYVITALLGLIPLAGLVTPGTVIVDGKSGTTGAGRAMKDTMHVSHVSGGFTAYAAPAHRHTGEIEHYLGVHGADVGPISFTPHLLPVPRGLMITAYADLADGVGADDVQAALVKAYADERFVTVLDPGTFPTTKAVIGSNSCHVSATVDPRTGRVLVTSVTDNLVKGAAGGALQNANVMLGLPEETALPTIGMYP